MRKGKNMLGKTPTDEIVTDLYEQAEDGTCPKKLAKKSAKHIRAQEAEIKRLRAALEPFAFLEEASTQEAWEMRHGDRFDYWIEIGRAHV